MRLTEKHLRFEISGILAPLYWINENDVAVEIHNGQYGGGNVIDKLGQLEDILESHSIETLEDLNNKLTALEIIKSKEMLSMFQDIKGHCFMVFNETGIEISKEEFDLLREVLL